MEKADWPEVGELIYVSINYWYHTHGSGPKFNNGPESTQLFCKTYEDIDPGCCLLAVNESSGSIAASCFYHPRETHVSIGIMNVHPNYFGHGAGITFVTESKTPQWNPAPALGSGLSDTSIRLRLRRARGHAPPPALQQTNASTIKQMKIQVKHTSRKKIQVKIPVKIHVKKFK